MPFKDTWWVLSERERWSMNAAFLGEHPLPTADGPPCPAELADQPLTASGKRFVLWGVAGDTDFFVNDMHMFHWANETMCLGRCLASRNPGPYLFSDFRPSHSLWLQNRLSGLYIVHNHLANHRHPWFDVYGASALMLHYDEMHVLSQQGCVSHAIANVLFDIIFLQIKGNHMQALNTIWDRISALYIEFPSTSKLNKLTLEMFCKPDAPYQSFPMLSTAIKATETRHLLPIAAALSREYNTGEPHHGQRDAMMRYITDFYRLMDTCPIVPSPDVGERMFSSLHKFLLTYQTLASWAADNGHLMYSTVSKHHHAFHMGEQAWHMNPHAVHGFVCGARRAIFYGCSTTRLSYLCRGGQCKAAASVVQTGVEQDRISQIRFRHRRKFDLRNHYHTLQARYLCPRATWTYGFEDFVGKCIKIAFSCASGTNGLHVPRKALLKFRLAFHLQLKYEWEME
jgi:hypothetical protein